MINKTSTTISITSLIKNRKIQIFLVLLIIFIFSSAYSYFTNSKLNGTWLSPDASVKLELDNGDFLSNNLEYNSEVKATYTLTHNSDDSYTMHFKKVSPSIAMKDLNIKFYNDTKFYATDYNRQWIFIKASSSGIPWIIRILFWAVIIGIISKIYHYKFKAKK